MLHLQLPEATSATPYSQVDSTSLVPKEAHFNFEKAGFNFALLLPLKDNVLSATILPLPEGFFLLLLSPFWVAKVMICVFFFSFCIRGKDRGLLRAPKERPALLCEPPRLLSHEQSPTPCC